MPVQSQSAHQMPSKFASTMEPSLQSKKRVDPPFLKTTPAKSDFDGVPLQSKKRVTSPSAKPMPKEPVMQAKKRIQPSFVDSKPAEPAVVIQSKKKVEEPSSEPIQCEPPLQSKHRTPGPPTTLGTGFYGNGAGDQQEYALLGNQDKFSSNVKYRPKSATANVRDVSPPKQIKLQQKKTKENRDPSPAPKVNTEQFRQPSTPLAPRKPKGQPNQLAQELKESNVRKEPKVTRSPKQSQSEPRLSKGRKEETSTEHSQVNGTETAAKAETVSEPKTKMEQKVEKLTKTEQKSQKEAKVEKVTKTETSPVDKSTISLVKGEEVKNLDRADPVKESMKSKRIIENMNEFAQTNMDKGVADSAPEAPADYALRYKTGISAPRPTKKVSEYQKQFAWKSGPPASPLLDAEQVVYNSNPQLSPPKKAAIPKVTEYQKQYKAYKLIPVPEPEPQPKKNTKLQKSKSMEDLSPAEIKPAGSAPVISPNNKRLTMETGQTVPEPVPEVPKRKNRLYRSEYRSNFKQPEKFDYVRGSWQGAAPPHIQIKGPEETTNGPALSTWFAEVIELRRKAQEYRQRALGTHFSREHMAQLMAKQNDLWEASTPTARSTLSALSLESGLNSHRSDKKAAGSKAVRAQAYREADSTAATMDSLDDQSTARLSEVEQPQQKRQAWAEPEGEDDDPSHGTPSTYASESPVQEGRLPTPVLRKEVESSKTQKRRHHLDRTTPSTGGAILSSPPDTRKKRSGKRMVTSRSVDSVSLGTVDDETPRSVVEHQPLAGQKTYKLSATQGNISAAPTYGMPSRDTHALLDYDAESDRELRTQFVYTPARQTPGGLSAVDENYGQTYNKSKPDVANMREFSWDIGGGLPLPRGEDADDCLSVSMQSIASSCSIASATLERARKRKEEFWGKTSKAK